MPFQVDYNSRSNIQDIAPLHAKVWNYSCQTGNDKPSPSNPGIYEGHLTKLIYEQYKIYSWFKHIYQEMILAKTENRLNLNLISAPPDTPVSSGESKLSRSQPLSSFIQQAATSLSSEEQLILLSDIIDDTNKYMTANFKCSYDYQLAKETAEFHADLWNQSYLKGNEKLVKDNHWRYVNSEKYQGPVTNLIHSQYFPISDSSANPFCYEIYISTIKNNTIKKLDPLSMQGGN